MSSKWSLAKLKAQLFPSGVRSAVATSPLKAESSRGDSNRREKVESCGPLSVSNSHFIFLLREETPVPQRPVINSTTALVTYRSPEKALDFPKRLILTKQATAQDNMSSCVPQLFLDSEGWTLRDIFQELPKKPKHLIFASYFICSQ